MLGRLWGGDTPFDNRPVLANGLGLESGGEWWCCSQGSLLLTSAQPWKKSIPFCSWPWSQAGLLLLRTGNQWSSPSSIGEMKESDRKWLVPKLACFNVIDIDLTGAFFKEKKKKNHQYLPCSSPLLVLSQNAGVLRQWDLNQHRSMAVPLSLGSAGAERGPELCTSGSAGAESISLVHPGLIILAVIQFIASPSLTKMNAVVGEADPVHPSTMIHIWSGPLADQILHFSLQQKPDLQSSKMARQVFLERKTTPLAGGI